MYGLFDQSEAAGMEFVILGPTSVHRDGERIPLGAAKQRGMLAVLLYHLGEPVRIETMVQFLWDDRNVDRHRVHLYSLASRIRSVLNGLGLADAMVRINGIGAYRLELDPDLVDLHRFKRDVQRARTAADKRHYETSATLLINAVELWRDEPLADLRGASAERIRAALRESLLDAHKLLAECQSQLGQHYSVLARLEPLLTAHDLDETLARHWISALCAVGREDDARAFFVSFRRRFRKEMRTEPGLAPPRTDHQVRRPVREAGTVGAAAPTAPAPRQLPNDINDFIGRDDLLAELNALANPDNAGTKVVVISGMPGAGKTTLAAHWAHQQRDRFPDGQLYINANAYGPAPPTAPHEALAGFLRAFGMPPAMVPADTEQRRDQLNRILTGRRVVILLDNVHNSEQARALIPASETCVTLITSRNRLKGLTIREGVRSATVDPLETEECLSLLRHLIGSVRADEEPGALLALARLSGGLPLALRIIGEHVAERPRARIADLVGELNAQILASDGEDDEEADLYTVFAWSYNALKPEGAHLFRILGLHPGSSFTPGAAAALVDKPLQHTEHLLNTLAKAHLINHDTVRRYRFHDLLQRFSADRAYHEENIERRTDAIRRLLNWYLLSATNAARILAPHRPPVPDLPVAEGIDVQVFATDVEAMKWCEAERANLRTITRLAVDRGFFRHGWQIPGAVHEVLGRYGRQNEVLELDQLALSAAEADGHLIGQIGTLNNLGVAYLALHDYGAAADTLEIAQRLARRIGDVEAEAVCSHNLASAHLELGDPEAAVDIYQSVLGALRGSGNAAREASTLHQLGAAYRRMNRHAHAVHYYTAALAIRERIGSLRGQGTTLSELAALYLETGARDLALEHCQLALEIHHRTKDESAHCDTLITMADVQRELGLLDQATEAGQCALDISDDIGDARRRAHALAVLADTHIASGNSSIARLMCVDALGLLDRSVDPESRALRERLMHSSNRLQ